jgi:hypothetical protein
MTMDTSGPNMTLWVSVASAPGVIAAVTVKACPGAGRAGLAATFAMLAGGFCSAVFTARGVPWSTLLAAQAVADALSAERLTSSRDGPAPSGGTGHGAASSYVTLSTTEAALSTRETCSPPLDRLLPAKEKSAAKPNLVWKAAGSGVPTMREFPGITVPAGNRTSAVASVMPTENDHPETSTGSDPRLASSMNSSGSGSTAWYISSEITTSAGAAPADVDETTALTLNAVAAAQIAATRRMARRVMAQPPPRW